MSSDLRISAASLPSTAVVANQPASIVTLSNSAVTAIAQNQMRIAAAQAKVQNAENQLFADLKEQFEKIFNENAQLRSRITGITTEINTAKQEYQKSKVALDANVEDWECGTSSYKKWNADLSRQSESLTKETAALTSSNQQLNQSVASLNPSIDLLRKELERLNIAAMYAEDKRREWFDFHYSSRY